MAKFFVGQRVRIIYSLGWPALDDEQGTVVGRSDTGGIRGGSEWIVAPDCWGSPFSPYPSTHGGTRFGPSSKQLEPILPEGAAPSIYSYQELMDKLREGERV